MSTKALELIQNPLFPLQPIDIATKDLVWQYLEVKKRKRFSSEKEMFQKHCRQVGSRAGMNSIIGTTFAGQSIAEQYDHGILAVEWPVELKLEKPRYPVPDFVFRDGIDIVGECINWLPDAVRRPRFADWWYQGLTEKVERYLKAGFDEVWLVVPEHTNYIDVLSRRGLLDIRNVAAYTFTANAKAFQKVLDRKRVASSYIRPVY